MGMDFYVLFDGFLFISVGWKCCFIFDLLEMNIGDVNIKIDNMKMFFLVVVLVMFVVVCFFFVGNGEKIGFVEKFDVYKVNEVDWVEKDFSQILLMICVMVKVLKDVILEKNGNGGVDIKMGDYYVIFVY